MNNKVILVNPVIDHSVRSLCIRQYPGHPKGCPNFNKKKGCPPDAKLFEDVYDMSLPVYAIINIFDFKSHVEKMRKLHPDWSDRQLKCCLYWQKGARNKLLIAIKQFLSSGNYFNQGYRVETCPEAMGIDITETMKQVGIILEWPPETVTYQIAIAAIRIPEYDVPAYLSNGYACWVYDAEKGDFLGVSSVQSK